MGYSGQYKFQGVVFHTDAVFSTGKDGQSLAVMPRLQEAFNALTADGYKLILATHNRDHALSALKEHGLTDVFTQDGNAQICVLQKSQKSFSDCDPLIYWEGLKALGIKSQKTLFAITASVEGIRSARATGISNVIGYYGSPDVPYGEVLSRRDALSRQPNPLSGTNHLMGSYGELPEIMHYLKAHI